jgi:hypothetical protein
MANATLATPDHEAWSTRLRDIGFWAESAALIGLVVLVIVFQSLNSTFLRPGNIASMLVAAAILIILAVGQTFVIATAGIDLSVASSMTLGAVAFGQAYAASLSYAIEQTRSTGFDLLELSLHDSTNLDVTARASLQAAGIDVACSRGLAFDADVFSADTAVVERGEKLLQDSLAVTDALGGTHFTGALYSALGKYDRPLSEAGRRNVVSVLKGLAREARDRGMTLGLEICNRYRNVGQCAALEGGGEGPPGPGVPSAGVGVFTLAGFAAECTGGAR